MQRVFDFIETKKNEIYQHPDLVRERMVEQGPNFREIPVHRKFDWLPAFIHLSMTFRDINVLYLRYDDPKNEFERAINAHVDEDSQHFNLLIHDMKVLGFDEPQPLSESVQTIWSEQSIEVRKYMYSVMNRAAICGDDPFLRIACMQAAESTVEMFFEISTMHAKYFEEQTGVRLDYFGSKHADSEAEHGLDLEVFTRHTAPDDIVAKGIEIADEHFASFRRFLDFKESVTRDPEEQLARWPEPKIRPAFRLTSVHRPPASEESISESERV